MEKSNRTLVVIFFVAVLAICHSYGQSKAFFKKLTISEGLSNNRVKSFAKEPDGFLWIGTDNGLNRYDGKEIRIYNEQNSNLTSNDIQDILIDSNGNIWIATLDGGLALYDSEKDDFRIFEHIPENKNSIPSNRVISLFEDSSGTFWIGLESGLSTFDRETGSFMSLGKIVNDYEPVTASVTSFLEDVNNNLWIGTLGGGLLYFDHEKKSLRRVRPKKPQINTDLVYTIEKLNEAEMLIGTLGSGLMMLNLETQQFSDFFKEKLGMSENVSIIRSLLKDSKNNLWIGTDGNGVFQVEKPNAAKPKFHNYIHNNKAPYSISGNGVYEIIEDEDLNIWIGTAWNGINVFDGNNDFEIIYSDITGNDSYPVLSIFKDSEKIYLGSDGNGLTIYNSMSNETSYYNNQTQKSVSANFVQCITKSRDGTFWLGSFTNGLINFNVETGAVVEYKNRLENQNSISYNDVRYIIEDDDNLWLATWGGGLNFFDAKTGFFEHFREDHSNKNSISNDNVISLQKEGDTLWIATFGGGINAFDIDTGRFTHFRHNKENPNSISSDNTVSLLKDSKGYLWVGTSGSGINRFSPDMASVERFENEEALRYQVINSIVEDLNGKIWFGTTQGIFNYDYKTDKFSSLPDFSDKLHINSVFVDESGYLYFGGLNGAIRFNPEAMVQDQKQPKIVFTNLKLFNKDLKIGEDEILKKNITYQDKISLKYNQNFITLEFAALEFPFSNDLEYSIKMENFDEDWRNIGSEPMVTYTNLSHGNYTFKVRSRGGGMDWSDRHASLAIDISRPFWLEWWAYAIYAMFAATLLYLFRRYTVAWERMKSDLKLEQLTHEKDKEIHNFKQQFFTNISHEIRTPVTLILGSVKQLMKSQLFFEEKSATTFEIIKRNSDHLLGLVNELLDIRSLEHNKLKLKVTQNDLVIFCKEIYLSFAELAREKKIDYTFDCKSISLDLWFDKTQLEKVLYNLLSNAFKYTSKGRTVNFALEEEDNQVILTISDTGDGISEKQLSKIFDRFYQIDKSVHMKKSGFGLGLSIAKEIIKLHGGEINVKSVKGQGSTFSLKLLKGKEHYNAELLKPSDESNGELIENYIVNKNKDSNFKEGTALFDFSELKGQTILIVEDNEDIRNYLKELLSEHCMVLEAPNGKEGLSLLENDIPDLIISDIMMPVMDGIEFTRALKSEINTSHIPVILLTARASLAHKMEGYDTGADEYLTKPFNVEMLIARIKNLISNRDLLRKKFSTDGLFIPSERSVNKRDRIFLEKLTSLIQENLDSKDLKTDFICKNIGMSHSVIYKKTKALTGLSLVEFVRDYKLKIARKLLIEQRLPVIEVCYKVGYSDRKYFSKMFKQRFGKNPSDFLQDKLQNSI